MTSPDLALAASQARSVLVRASSGYAHWLDPSTADDFPLKTLATEIFLDHPQSPERGDSSPVLLEVADPAPVPVRERVRCRVRLFGDGARSRDSDEAIRLRPVSVQLVRGDEVVAVRPLDLWHAQPDPLALAEAELIGHLHTWHPETVEQLCRHVPSDLRACGQRVVPVGVDRAGIVMRVEHESGHVDTRLDFPCEVTCRDEAAEAIIAVAAAPISRPTGQPTGAAETRRRSLMSALMEAGPAAARLCAPEQPPGSAADNDTPPRRRGDSH